MLQIAFEKPFPLMMEVVEADDRVPSMRVEMKVSSSQFQHSLKYHGMLWIGCLDFSKFIAALNSSPVDALLKDMNGNFSLSVVGEGWIKTLSCELMKADVGGKKRVEAVFWAEVDDEVFQAIKNAFQQFPVWW